MADRPAVRGDIAYALFNALGFQTPTRTDRFTDGGYLAGVTSTLADLGITNGVSETEFGTTRGLNRGEAFTMIARTLGLAGPNTDIATASQALVDAGIVRGYANGDLGLGDQLTTGQMGMLMDRIAPMLDQPDPRGDGTISVRDNLFQQHNAAIENQVAQTDPTYAAFLQASGVAESNLRDEIGLRSELFDLDTERRREAYAARADQARGGINTDFENRGFFRSGTRGQRILDSNSSIEMARRHEQERAAEAHNRGQRDLGRQLDDVLGARAVAEAEGRVREEEYRLGTQYRD